MNRESSAMDYRSLGRFVCKEFELAGNESFPSTSDYNVTLWRIVDTASQVAVARNIAETEFITELKRALDFVKRLRNVLNPDNQTPQSEGDVDLIAMKRHDLWSHRNPAFAYAGGYESEHARRPDRRQLIGAIDAYLDISWLIDEEIEWMLVDSLVFDEVCAFGERLKLQLHRAYAEDMDQLTAQTTYEQSKGRSFELTMQIVKKERAESNRKLFGYAVVPMVLYGIVFAVGSPAIANALGEIYLVAVAVGLSVRAALRGYFNPAGRSEPFAKLQEIYPELETAYGVLDMTPRNPGYIKAVLLDAVHKGVIWESAIFAILERAIARDPVRWQLPTNLEITKFMYEIEATEEKAKP